MSLAVIERAVDRPTRHQLWGDQQDAMIRLLRLVTEAQEDVYHTELIRSAFALWPRVIVCMDERVSLEDPEVPEIGVPGNGIFFSKREVSQFIWNLCVMGISIDSAPFHDHCGAWKMFAKHVFNKHNAVIDPISAGKGATKRLNTALGLETKPVRVGYGSEAQYTMLGHPSFHHARGVVIDGSGRLNAARLGLPAMLHLSVRYFPNVRQMIKSARLAQAIAMGSHGFGDWFTSWNPFVILLVGDPTSPAWTTRALRARLDVDRWAIHGKTTILSITAPAA